MSGKKKPLLFFGTQKVISVEMIEQIDQWMKNYSRVIEENYSVNTSDIFGSGAAGEIGFALLSFLNNEIVSGISEIFKLVHLENEMKSASLIITGEGKMDEQTLNRETPTGIVRLAKK